MGTKGPKWCNLLIIIVLVSLLSTSSFAGGHERRFFNKYEGQMRSLTKETPKKSSVGGGERAIVPHSRDLRVKTDDYGGYDPSPTMNKPPFKLIPN